MRIFCILAGIHPTLPNDEILGILKSSDISYSVIEKVDNCLILDLEDNGYREIINRAAFCKGVYTLLFKCNLDFNSIKTAINDMEMTFQEPRVYSFSVRIEKIKKMHKNLSHSLSSVQLESYIGALVLTKFKNNLKVDLVSPELKFKGIIVNGSLIFGIELHKSNSKEFYERSGPNRPYFHPCGMDAKFARLMVNLAEIKSGAVIYDPHCGIGSILIEAGILNYHVIGSDISWKMIHASKINLNYYKISNFMIFRADSQILPIKKIDNIITDPPYGRSSPLKSSSIFKLYKNFLSQCKDIIYNNNKIVFATPNIYGNYIEEILKKMDFIIVRKYDYYIHRSLIRNLWIIRVK
ncbi:MAG: N-6 DNA methylase [Candidatus Helarchaeota archaeon]